MLIVTMSLISLTGCKQAERGVYVPPGASFEVARPVNVVGFITNKATGDKEMRPIEVQPGWYIVRPRVQEFGKGTK